MSEFKRALLFYFSLSLSSFSFFFPSFHFFFATILSLSLFFSLLFDGVVPICMKNTIPRSNTRTRPRRYGVHYSRLVFFFFSPLVFLILLKLSAVFCYFAFFCRFSSVLSDSYDIYICMYVCICIYDYFEHFRAPLSRIVLEMFNSFL